MPKTETILWRFSIQIKTAGTRKTAAPAKLGNNTRFIATRVERKHLKLMHIAHIKKILSK